MRVIGSAARTEVNQLRFRRLVNKCGNGNCICVFPLNIITTTYDESGFYSLHSRTRVPQASA